MNAATDPALDMLNRALAGDENALAFLDRTSSIYVLDATDPSQPKTYGGWNFIHQALNELERHERNYGSNGVAGGQPGLRSHVQLLAAMSQRVARRSPSSDRKLVSTCVENAAQYHATANEAESLIVLNSEIREIVMGRVAAMVFDFSFHNPNGPHLSAFSDPVAMEGLCCVLAANAVSSGPQAISHFMLEWIIPSVRTLPPFAVACVILHLGNESMRKVAPAGTKDMLQRMSSAVIAIVLAPVLNDAIQESGEARGIGSNHERHSRVAAVSIRAMERWCAATDLSLPQIKYVCTKVNLKAVEILSDAMYSDSQLVMEAVAELMDRGLAKRNDGVLRERMTQTRYIMEVDEAAFQAISEDDLRRIEAKEMDSIVSELVTAIGLQRFRFAERQEKGDLAGCRCLARIASSVCKACIDATETNHLQPTASGMIELLLKAAAHPSVNICGIALEALSELTALDPNFPLQLLPILQHRAIIPHVLNGGVPSLAASEVCGVDIDEFDSFRSTVLTDALEACYKRSPGYYMNSCTAAVEEFCRSQPTVKTSFQLEAALFCLEAVADDSIQAGQTLMVRPNAGKPENSDDTTDAPKNQLSRCTEQLEKKPICVTANPLTLAQACRFLGKHAKWYAEKDNEMALLIAAELCLSSMTTALLLNEDAAQKMTTEMSVSPFSEAAIALNLLLSQNPNQFANEQAIKALVVGWEASYVASNQIGAVTIDAREALCEGTCLVLASMPNGQRERPIQVVFIPTIECMRSMTKLADESVASAQGKEQLGPVLVRVADEIRILSTMAATCARVTSDTPSKVEEPHLSVLRQAWPSISHAAEKFNKNETVSQALGKFLVGCLPRDININKGMSLLNELCSLASSILTNTDGSKVSLQPVAEFVTELVNVHGGPVETGAIEIVSKSRDANAGEDGVGRLLEGLIMSMIEASRSALGAAGTGKHQGQGQQPFESKAQPEPDETPGSTEGLSGIFSILTACANRCPVFLIHLRFPTRAPGTSESSVFARAVESAAEGLTEADVETVGSAMLFLESAIKLSASPQHESIQKAVSEALSSRVRRGIIFEVIDGVCGKFHQNLLERAASLLYSAVRSFPPAEMRACRLPAIKQETFHLGEHAQHVAIQVLDACAQGAASIKSLTDLVVDVWDLHQVDDLEAISSSDMVMRLNADKYLVQV